MAVIGGPDISLIGGLDISHLIGGPYYIRPSVGISGHKAAPTHF